MMDNPLNEPGPVRPGEELDTARLEAYLTRVLPDLAPPMTVAQFPSGFSNLTYLLHFANRDLVLRRPPFGSQVKSAHDMGREFRVLSALRDAYPPAPTPLHFCEDEEVLGAEFYIMERVRGVILREEKPHGFQCSAPELQAYCTAFVQNLVDLHRFDYTAVGLGALRREGSFTARQAHGWIKRYYNAQTDNIPSIDQAATWLKEYCPEDTGAVLVHNDYKFDNLVLDPDDMTRIVGLLDWEMCTIGDPLVDLGVAIGYWTRPEDMPGLVPCFLTLEPGAMTRRELAERYAELTGRDVSNITFYYVFALIRLAVNMQQICYRYKQGLTRDKRFERLFGLIRWLGDRAVRSIETNSL